MIDTNIFIDREKHNVVPEDLQKLLKILNLLRAEILVHPESIREIKNDTNAQRKKINLSKIATYSELASPPNPISDNFFLETVGATANVHDQIDNCLLYAVYKNAADFLISEDREIHKKALRIGFKKRVFSSHAAVNHFSKKIPTDNVERLPALKLVPIYTLDLDDPFFNSLKKEYPDFEKWFTEKSREGRKGWVNFEGDKISALLIPKVENEAVLASPPLPSKKRLKICLFKAERSGQRLGELFIKLSIRYCVRNSIDELYLTHFTKKDDVLTNMLFEYGFSKVAKKVNGENVYLKRLISENNRQSLSPVEINRLFYPSFYDGITVRKFIIPIKPKYHDRLFTDSPIDRQTTMDEHFGEFIVEGNTIKKAYLCHASTRRISAGDILLFYRSRDRKELTALGTLESVYRSKDPEEIIEKVKNRTVYSRAEIQEIAKKSTIVLLFRWNFYLPRSLGLNKLKELNVLSNAPQTITKINHIRYMRIKKECRLDERYTIN